MMWSFIKFGILVLLLFIVLGILAYLYAHQWVSNKVQDRIKGQDRVQSDIQFEPLPQEDPDLNRGTSHEEYIMEDDYNSSDHFEEDEEEFDSGYDSDV